MNYFTAERSFYIPAGATKVSCKGTDAVAYIYATASGAPAAAMFAGKRAKPDARYRYRTPADRETAVRTFFASARASADRKAAQAAERRAALAKPHGIEVGHVFQASWGYDQTNVDWYIVTALVGRRMVEVVKVGGIASATGMDTGTTLPNVEHRIGEPFRRILTPHNGLRIDSVRHATLWDGTPARFSTYA